MNYDSFMKNTYLKKNYITVADPYTYMHVIKYDALLFI